jgi:phage tail sheath protein FI
MTLKFSESPAVQIKEIDLTGTVPSVTSTTGALVGDFNWGPVNTPTLIGNESELSAVFGNPTSGGVEVDDYLSAAYFLKYSSSLYVVNINPGAKASDSTFTAKYPGLLGNSISVSVCGPIDALDTDQLTNEFDNWTYASSFTSAPEGDELHVVVLLDGSVVETFEYVSSVEGSKTTNGTNNYVVDVLESRSSWVIASASPSPEDFTLVGGTKVAPSNSDYHTGYDAFANKEEVQIDFLIAPAGNQANISSMHSKLLSIAEDRKDCVAVVSVDYNSASTGDVSGYLATNNYNSSYLVVDSNWLKVYDKYNDTYVSIPAASSTAGIMAASDSVSAPWFSPAGSRRGQYLGVTELLHNPTKTQRDVMYKQGVNPIVSMPGQGIMLFGDKTHLKRPSAFDRINVRRLFLVIERAISEAGQNVMFEFNDEFTRAEFVNIVEPFLREIQGRRGISDFRVVCDETNNTPEVIDRNEFIASCFIKPARSINYVTLNFVAVRTGVDFEEVVGTV